MAAVGTVVLRAGRCAVAVRGGDLLSLTSWTVEGLELLAVAEDLPVPYRVHGRRAGVTLLHPWANRVGGDVFGVAGRNVAIGDDVTVSRDAGGLAIHGLAAPSAWSPVAVGDDCCTVHRDVPSVRAFPFAHAVDVEVRVTAEDRVEVVTAVTADADAPLPLAFGWHPYFVAPGPRAGWVLGLPDRLRLAQDDAGLPTGEAAAEPAERAPLRDRAFDDGYVDAAGSVWSVGPVEVALGEGYAATQVFAPTDREVVSIEPMTAPTDALRSGHRLRCLEPGERFVARFAMTYREGG